MCVFFFSRFVGNASFKREKLRTKKKYNSKMCFLPWMNEWMNKWKEKKWKRMSFVFILPLVVHWWASLWLTIHPIYHAFFFTFDPLNHSICVGVSILPQCKILWTKELKFFFSFCSILFPFDFWLLQWDPFLFYSAWPTRLAYLPSEKITTK